jgi:hypothetical protein
MMPLSIGSRQAQTSRPLAVVAEDHFTGADASALLSHVPDGFTAAQSWTLHTGSTAGDSTIQSNRVMPTNDSSTRRYYHSWVPNSADYLVEADAVALSDNNVSISGVIGRLNTASSNFYTCYVNAVTNLVTLNKFVAGAPTVLGSVAVTPSGSTVFHLGLLMVGQRIAGFLNGQEFASVLDSAHSAAGRAGLYLQNNATAATGIHIDNFRVSQ